MAAKKTTKKKGRPKQPRKRLGAKEKKTVDKLLRIVKRKFQFQADDAQLRETTLNTRLIALLKQADPLVTNQGIAAVSFIGETYRPECTLTTAGRPFSLFALECKKLHDHSAKRLFKEGLAQAHLYLTISKAVALVLYDFTTGAQYVQAFGRGNTASSRFAKRLREEAGIYIIVRSPNE